MDEHLFEFVSNPQEDECNIIETNKKYPVASISILGIMILLCLIAPFITSYDPHYMNVKEIALIPSSKHLLGTDSLGRDVLSGILYGGRVSIFIGLLSTLVSTMIAIIYGTISGYMNNMIDNLMMRLCDMILSIPSLLLVIVIQGILRSNNPIILGIIIGTVSFCPMAKIVRSEVKQLRNSEYVLASQMLGGNFFHILLFDLLPNFIHSILFMIIMNIVSSIMMESTLSFMGLGLDIEVISWGSMLSLSLNALLNKQWWMILFPGCAMVMLLVCISNISEFYKKQSQSNG